MIAPAIPQNEQERLKDLHLLDVLQPVREDRFDRITRLVADMFGVPMVYISFVDANQQFFKSRVGVDACSTSREVSFCGHAILQDDVFVIEDAHEDSRFRDNPLVTGDPHIRFYAGKPLKGTQGHNVGTLCLADRIARKFTEEDMRKLNDFALIVEKELHLTDLLEMQKELLEMNAQVQHQLEEASDYVTQQLPDPLLGEDEDVQANWIFKPSTHLGGDSLFYGWIDEDHFGMYLVDVTGHGVSAALLSTSISHFAHSQNLTEMNFDLSVAASQINNNFQSSYHSGRLFTMWAGIYQKSTRKLNYFNGGHPSPMLFRAASGEVETLEISDLIFGVLPDYNYRIGECTIEPGDRLLVFSDGIFEIKKEGGDVGTYDEFLERVKEIGAREDGCLKMLVEEQKTCLITDTFDDDVSIMGCRFQ